MNDIDLLTDARPRVHNLDRSDKQRLYATAGIPLYWLVNVPESQVEVYEQPDATSGTYAQRTNWTSRKSLTWNLSPTQSVEINIADLFR